MIHARGMKTASAAVVTSAFGGLVAAATLNVPGDFDTIQGCINAAVSGADECVVAPGTYNEVIDFLGKAITLRSSDGEAVTTIDRTNIVVKCVSGEGSDTVLEGFTITGGMHNENSAPTVTRCTFNGNSRGMYNSNSSPTVTNCTFSGNSAFDGGGMYNLNSAPTVTNCTFSENTAEHHGGGMFNGNSTPMVTNCTFSGNNAVFAGGGMGNILSSPTVTNCTFSGNTGGILRGGMGNGISNLTAGLPYEPLLLESYALLGPPHGIDLQGGGMANTRLSNPTVTNCTFSGNTAVFAGGGLANYRGNPTVTNCTFSGNTASNGGGAMSNFITHLTVTNCILWGNSPEEILNDSTATISFSDVKGGWPGEGNIDVDPLFVDADGLDDVPGTQDDDLRLSPDSPCIDAGDNTAVPTGVTTDLDGNPRFIDDPFTPDTGNGQPPIVDMGAYEFPGPLRAALDIKPGSCPNPLTPNLKGKGVVPMALVGGESFDVTNVNLDTLILFRPDGIGESIAPLTRSRGQTGSFEDVTGPAGDDPCACSETGGEGIGDLVLKFSSREMVRALQLDSLERSALLTIALRGQLFDGTEFAALDCVWIVGSAITRAPELDRANPANP